jgi:hypothetical protein
MAPSTKPSHLYAAIRVSWARAEQWLASLGLPSRRCYGRPVGRTTPAERRISYGVGRLARALRREIGALVAPHGLTVPQRHGLVARSPAANHGRVVDAPVR